MKVLLCILLSCVPFFLMSQGLLNNGGKIVIGSTSYLSINGTTGHFVNTTSGTDGTIDNRGTLSIEGDWTNYATNTVFVTPTLGTVVFSGTSAQAVNGNTKFNHLTVNNSSGLSLNATNDIVGILTLTNGVFAINSNLNFDLNTGAIAGTGVGSTTGNIRFF